MDPSTFTIDGFGPLPLVRPTTVAELGDLVRRAAAAGQAVYPVGGQTMLGLGNSPRKPGIALDLRGLDRVVDFPARDMTVTVEAGITIARLQALLAPENLQLPIDVPQPERATLGGILACNVSGPRRLGYGTLRDYVIGISVVNDEGNEFKAGGRVVKNVAGYDLCKLLVGSLGTLGIITQVTLKLRPLPEETAVVAFGSETVGLSASLDRLHGSRTRPMYVEVLNPPAARVIFGQGGPDYQEAAWTMVVGFEGNADAVGWQVQQLVKEFGSDHSLDARIGASAGSLRHALLAAEAEEAELRLKASVPPHAVAEFAGELARRGHAGALRAHAGNGIVRGSTAGLTMEPAAAMVTTWRLLAGERGGRAIVERCPPDVKKTIDIWGLPPTDVGLMRLVKRQFDPRGVFNPGRFVSDI